MLVLCCRHGLTQCWVVVMRVDIQEGLGVKFVRLEVSSEHSLLDGWDILGK